MVTTTADKVRKIVLSVLLWFLGILMVVPFVWMLSTAFKTQKEVFTFPIQWIPKEPTFKAFKLLFKKTPYVTYFLNSIKVTALSVCGTYLSCSMAGYAYAKIPFKGRNQLFMVKLTSTMLPGLVTMVPTYIVFSRLGLINHHAALWLPYFLGGTFGVFLMRQAFMQLPDALMESARIDGAGNFRTYWSIAMPNVKATTITLCFMYFLWSFNDYEGPLLYIHEKNLFTLPYAVKLFSDKETANYPVIMAANLLMIAPMMLFFFTCQKFFVNALVGSGIKG